MIIIPSLGQEDPQKGKMTTHASILVRKIPWTEEREVLHPWDYEESDTAGHA